MKNDAYSPFKAVRHLDIVQATREARPARPAHVQLILSDLCNQACHFCAYRDPSYTASQLFYEVKPGRAGLRRDPEHPERNYNPDRMIPTVKAFEIVDDCARLGVSGIQLTGGGEPTVHPDFDVVLQRAQNARIATSLVTNGVAVGKKLSMHYGFWVDLMLGLSWVRFSIDAGREETYTQVRSVPAWHFSSALAGIRRLREERDARGKGPVIGVGYVVTPENWREVVDGVKLARDLGADNIRISAQFSSTGENLFASFHEEAAALCREAEGLSRNGFEVYNRFGEKLDDLHLGSPDYDRCGYQTFTTYIGADLNVYRCCVLAYNERGVVGNLREQRFADLWLSQERADAMARFDARGCPRCQFNSINRNLDYLLRPESPAHSEFV